LRERSRWNLALIEHPYWALAKFQALMAGGSSFRGNFRDLLRNFKIHVIFWGCGGNPYLDVSELLQALGPFVVDLELKVCCQLVEWLGRYAHLMPNLEVLSIESCRMECTRDYARPTAERIVLGALPLLKSVQIKCHYYSTNSALDLVSDVLSGFEGQQLQSLGLGMAAPGAVGAALRNTAGFHFNRLSCLNLLLPFHGINSSTYQLKEADPWPFERRVPH